MAQDPLPTKEDLPNLLRAARRDTLRNKARIESGQTYRSRKPSTFKRRTPKPPRT